MPRIPQSQTPSFAPTHHQDATTVRPNPPTPPPPPPPPPTPRYQKKEDSGFEPADSRKASARKWAARNGDGAGDAVSKAGGAKGLSSLGGLGQGGLVTRGGDSATVATSSLAQVAPGLTGADAYARMQTLSASATGAQQAVDAVEVQLTDDLALLGPTMTQQERDAYITAYRESNASTYAARDAAVADFATHLETEGDAIKGYLDAHYQGSPYTTPSAAIPLFEGLALVANSPRAGAAVDFLAEGGALLSSVAAGAGHDLERDVYGPALNATMADAMALGQSPEQAVAASRALIERMPPGVRTSILGSDPTATLDTLSRAVTGDVAALTALSTHAAAQGTQGASALFSSALSVAMLTRPEVLAEPNVLKSIAAPMSRVGMGAAAISGSLTTVASVLQRVTATVAGRFPSTAGAAAHAADFAAEAPALARLIGKSGNILGALTASINTLELLSREEKNNGTYLQVGVQAATIAAGALSFCGVLTGGTGIAVSVGLFILNEIGKAWEQGIHDDQVREAVIRRATELGVPDAAARVNLVMDHPNQVRDLATLGIDYPGMREFIAQGITDTSSLVKLAGAFELDATQVDQMLGLFAPRGALTASDTDLRYFMGYFEQARAALPQGTPEQLATWMTQNPPPPPYGGAYYDFTLSMTRLLTTSAAPR
ncbi:hypothetical protein ACN469_32035 [Corallococcus terminator]